jgi:DNA-binding transcriptional LysR family regulator
MYPDIVLDVLFENRPVDLLRDGLDISIRVMSDPPPALVARELGEVRYVACASRTYVEARGLPAVPEDLGKVAVLTADVAGHQLRLAAYFGEERREVLLEPTLISENFSFLRQAIGAGLGVGLVPDYVVKDEVARGIVVTALDEWRLSIFGSRMFMLYMPGRHLTRAIRTFIEFVAERARAGQSAPRVP